MSHDSSNTETNNNKQFNVCVNDLAGVVPDKWCLDEKQALIYLQHIVQWHPNSRPVIQNKVNVITPEHCAEVKENL